MLQGKKQYEKADPQLPDGCGVCFIKIYMMRMILSYKQSVTINNSTFKVKLVE
jgi:hypothetical protein